MSIQLKNVRLSFHDLFTHTIYNNEDTGKFSGTFLLDKADTAKKAEIDAAIEKMAADNKAKIPAAKRFITDGDEKEYDGYDDVWAIKAANGNKLKIYNKDGERLEIDDGNFYEGCYVHAIIDLWFQDNKYGKRINANLIGVRFHDDGEALEKGMSAEEVENQFNEMDDNDDDL